MSDLWSPVRTVWRSFRRAPGLTWAATLTLVLGIGLSAATGVVARAVAFAGLPIRDAERVVVLWGADRAGTLAHLPLPPTEMPALADAMRGVASASWVDYNGAYPWVFRGAGGDGAPLRMAGTLVGGRFFDVLGVRPVLGRALRPEDDAIGAPRVIVLSHAAWRARFGGDPGVVGRALVSPQRGASYTVVGVMPPGLDLPRGVQFWSAHAPTAAVNGSLADTWSQVDVVARLAPGATPEQARRAVGRLVERLARAQPGGAYEGARATVRTLPALVTGDVRPAFTALSAAAALVLLVTCATVAGLLLVRAASRRREFAVRAAVGASGARLTTAVLAEHAAVALVAGVLGTGLAALLVRAFAALAPAELPRAADLRLDGSLAALAAGVTALVVLLAGAGPALATTHVAPADALGGARAGAGGGTRDVRARRLLVGAQVAMALVVLAGASLVGRSLARLTALDLGLPAADRLALVELVPPAPPGGWEDPVAVARWRATLDAVVARVRAAPGVVAVAPAVKPPYSGTGGWDIQMAPDGAARAAADSSRRPYLNMEITSGDYLRATGVPLVAGRWLSDATDRTPAAAARPGGADARAAARAAAPRAVALSARAAQLLFPGVAPREVVGRPVRSGDDRFTVVGVVGDTRFREFVEPRPSAYFAYGQVRSPVTFLAVRTQGDPAAAAAVVRRAAAQVDRAVLVEPTGTMRTLTAAPLARPRLLAAVLGAYALVVVALAVGGLYAVVAGSVAARRREFGVRSAVGATPRTLAALVLGEGLRVAAAGVLVGLAAVLAGGRVLAASLYGVTPTDAATLGLATAALLAVCAVAVLLPARRAAHADPARVLRTE